MVSFIIVSYNTKDLLRDCLLSVQKHTKIPHEIIVVDNDSKDDSVKMIKKEFPKAKLIKNTENAGFAKAVNRGAKEAKGEFLFFLNSDAELNNDAAAELAETMESDKKNGVVGGLLKNTDGSVQRSFSKYYDLVPAALLLFGGDRVELLGRTEKAQEVDWVSGGCMMVRADVFHQVNGFDEEYFMYLEDMDLCRRIHDTGYMIIFDPSVSVTHIGQGSSNRSFAIVQIYKGLNQYYKKHKSKQEQLMMRFMLKTKALAVITTGKLTKNADLVTTYQQALRTL